ncbi:MAG: hypothetical protein IH920_05800 [Chloroflexi bacterium]|nr:hypothetical protein [Chloroflexota bacterium]
MAMPPMMGRPSSSVTSITTVTVGLSVGSPAPPPLSRNVVTVGGITSRTGRRVVTSDGLPAASVSSSHNVSPWALLRSRPRWDQDQIRPLPAIRGAAPNLAELPEECPYLPRCPKATNVCRTEPAPTLTVLEPDHSAACYNPILHGDGDGDAGFN